MKVFTESGSTYEVDWGARTVRRLPDPRGEAMRRDEEPIPFVTMADPVVDAPLHMVLNLRGDGVVTIRTTSPVVEVQP